nr:helicase-related protein [Candidatus Hamiltonella defensa]
MAIKVKGDRTRALADFKEGKITVLVETDIAVRGLDINQFLYVVNYVLPHISEDCVHRIGRTGRAQHVGDAISLGRYFTCLS